MPYLGPSGFTGVLWPVSLSMEIRKVIHDEFLTGVLMHSRLFCASVYLPDSWKPLDVFVQALERVGAALKHASCHGALKFLLVGDINLSFSARLERSSLDSFLGESQFNDCANDRGHVWTERHHMFLDFCLEHKFHLADTFLSADSLQWT